MEFIKYQATGNDFILIDACQMSDLDWSSLAEDLCQRHFGIGADGLLLVFSSTKADYKMRIFNPDGSEAETCGNGLRCFAKYIIENKKAGREGKVTIETLAGIKEAIPYEEEGEVRAIKLSMGKPGFDLKKLPAILPEFKDREPILDYPLKIKGKNLSLTFVSMGNPHVVHFLEKGEKVEKFPLSLIGPEVENHPYFPKRVNFEVVEVMNKNSLRVRVWERGAGETLSCGSGACAAAVAARLHGWVENEVDIILRGGTLNIAWDGNGEVMLKGPVEKVFSGKWSKNFR